MQFERVGQRYATFFALVVFFLLCALFYFFYFRYEEASYLPNRDVVAVDEVLTLKVSADGHFRVSGTINGQSVLFMLDTGASGVALSDGLARRLGLQMKGSQLTSTANGTVDARLSNVDTLAFGGWTFSQVPVFVLPEMDDAEVLLGMRILRHFLWNQADGVLHLRYAS
ncbi:MAG: retropepsin-like aspartic protease [Cardiobacteriaceae bacterium]|nr:retropepsin-like aspartic protease [Cardiobacteriaceae bacterium]